MNLRPPRDEDAAAVARLFSAVWPDPVSEAEIRSAWTSPRFDRVRDARVAGGDTAPRGYVDAELAGETGERAWMYVVGEPADELAAWGHTRAEELGAKRIFCAAWSENENAKRAIERRGFRLVRHSYRMAIDVRDARPSDPVWPDGIEARIFRPGDERVIYDVHQETFEDSWEFERRAYDEWAHWMLAPERHHPELWLLAVAGGEVAGVALCWPDEVVEGVGWVGILGVRRPWRRRGLGRALLLHAFDAFRSRGFRRVVLGVDAESLTGAHRLYESVGMHVAHRFDIYEKRVEHG